MTQHNLRYWLAALHLHISSTKLRQWLRHFSSIEDLFQATKSDLLYAGVTQQQIETLQHPPWDQVDKTLVWGQMPEQHLLILEDETYPSLLKEISNPPLILYVRGNLLALNKTQLAMVGSRHATFTALKNAEQFAYHLTQAGLAITSGLALGVDAASHRGALAAKGATIAVAGTGLDIVYPRAHTTLAEEIVVQGGAIISEFPLCTRPEASNFPRRNRIISGLSRGVLIIEAALKSGSLITARHAVDQGREVFAIPGSIHQPLTRGCHALIKQGAKLVETATDVLEELSFVFQTDSHYHPQQSQSHKIGIPANLTSTQRHVLDQIEYEITSIDVIILRSGLTAREVSSILLTLELHEMIQSVSGGYVRILETRR